MRTTSRTVALAGVLAIGIVPIAGSAARAGCGGGPNSPPYDSGAVHSLHGRGFDSARHGR
ncbi:hypothetical protein [Tautonia sociabilis]|uniref:Uncharacterized protein n=1 Tax=Tautonia sociabilis TaxID=2080755 RepID=A0A432MEA2_9BACT|nr:hypothetical protein [Tautonia sociabilis]RUL83575.1 hypothetical protein TsocGM_21970 [Tautonia sociabilis]